MSVKSSSSSRSGASQSQKSSIPGEAGNGKKIFEIDFIGGETYRVSQNYILQKRSLEPISAKDSLAALSARGLYHRDRDHFSKELVGSTRLIRSLTKQADKGGSHQLYIHYFQRALAFERLGQSDRAIEDYTTAIRNDRLNASQAYFNRAGLYQTVGKSDEALKDFNQAVALEPANIDYRSNRALLCRRMGKYMEAIHDTMVHRALELTPSVAKDLAQGKEIKLDPDILGKFHKTDDPILYAMRVSEVFCSLCCNVNQTNRYTPLILGASEKGKKT